jgi:hypothetical protein
MKRLLNSTLPASAWTPERKREYARERYKRLKALKTEGTQHKTLLQEQKPDSVVAKEELRRMAKWLLLEAKKKSS